VAIVPVWQQQRLLEEPAFHGLYESGLALFTEVESPVEAMAAISGATPPRHRGSTAAPSVSETGPALATLLRGLAEGGIAVPPFALLRHPEEAAAVIAVLGVPVAIKVSHARLLHKSDAGLVRFPIHSAEALATAAREMASVAEALGLEAAELVVQAGVAGGAELLVGFDLDPEMGPHIVLAAGGIHTELLQDSSVVLVEPRADLAQRAEAALRRLRIWPVLAGARGRPAQDWPAAVAQILLLADWFLASGLRAMEVNPLVVRPRGAVVVDARAVHC
jgi:acetyl-CoA synthetase